MDKFFPKVLVERPRPGSNGGKSIPGKGYRKLRKRQLRDDEHPVRESIRRPYQENQKELNENLKPLQRWLGQQVGRPWNNVYSEIMQVVDTNNAIQLHVLQHLRHMVQKDVEKRDEKRVFEKARYGWSRLAGELQFGDLYVDPDSGLLCRYKKNKLYNKRYSKDQKPDPDRPRRLDDTRRLVKIGGIWYLVTVEALPPRQKDYKRAPIVFDAVRKINVCQDRYYSDYAKAKEYYGDEVYGVEKRQLSGRDLKKQGLKNDTIQV